MNSFNHYSFGAIGAWMYTHSLGIARDENSPGFKHFILQPEPDPTDKMTFAEGYYDSMYGRIESRWEIKDNKYVYHFTVPANTTATLMLNALSVADIKAKEKALSSTSGVKYTGTDNKKYVFELQSGAYEVTVKK